MANCFTVTALGLQSLAVSLELRYPPPRMHTRDVLHACMHACHCVGF